MSTHLWEISAFSQAHLDKRKWVICRADVCTAAVIQDTKHLWLPHVDNMRQLSTVPINNSKQFQIGEHIFQWKPVVEEREYQILQTDHDRI